MGYRVTLDDVLKVFIISESAAVFGQDAVPPPVATGGLTKKRADYLVRMADHVRLEKKAQFLAKIRSMSIAKEEHVTHPELQIANSKISAAQEASVVENPSAPAAGEVAKGKLTPEAIKGMIQKHKEGKMTYEYVRVWVEATYSINVKANTVGYHVRKALEEEKKRKA